MAEKHSITIDKGSTFQLAVTWKDSDGIAINLTGYSARMQIRKTHESNEKIIDLTVGSGLTITALDGKIDIEIDDAVTQAVQIKNGVYDLEVESSGGIVTRLIEGDVTFTSEVTR